MTTSVYRTRRYRDRQRQGVLLAQVAIPKSLAESMISMGLIQEPLDPHVSGPQVMQQRGEALIEFIRRLRKP